MTSRDRRALMRGVFAIGAAVFLLRAMPWAVRQERSGYAVLRERSALLARARDEMASLSALRDSAATLSQALVALAPRLLSGSSPAEAGADLSGLMNLAASRAPARVERIDPRPDSAGEGRLGRVRVHAVLESDVRGLVALLKSIDASDEVVELDMLHVEAPGALTAERGPEILKIEVTVSGWYIKPRETGNSLPRAQRGGKRET
ncbi:MAG TPA: type II secretion system protein GspM [Gemmatimonadales bacterium]|nr:type II secretion system protein GspM [Gemmatimonadales bacterium]